MFGLWYSLLGLIVGSICSYLAYKKNRASKDWFILGFIFSFLAVFILYLLPSYSSDKLVNNLTEDNDFYIHAKYN
jgi:uncharacterized membrane protein YdjX (TVP38/TMEM64 family)